MGGGGGGGLPPEDLRKLTLLANERLRKDKEASSPHVFISFAYEDLSNVNLLRGQAKNENSEINFDDHSVKDAYNSENAEYIKSRIREKIERSSVTMVYLSESSASSDWVNWEIKESIRQGKGVVGVYQGTCPNKLPGEFVANKCKAVKWSHAEIMSAIESARNKR